MSRLYRSILLTSFISLTIILTGCLRTVQNNQFMDDASQAVEEVSSLVDDIIAVVKEGDAQETATQSVQWALDDEINPEELPQGLSNDTRLRNEIRMRESLFLDDAWFYDEQLYTLFEAIVNQEEQIVIEAIDTENFDKLCDSLYMIVGKTQYKYDIDGLQWTSDGRQIKIDIQYNEKAIEHTTQMMVAAQQIAEQIFTETMTDIEKLVTAYEYIQVNTVYDEEAADRINDGVYSAAHHAYGALIEGKAVCEGYASAFNVLLNLEGMETRLIESAAMNHVWSMVKMNETWYHCDVTFDDKLPDTKNNADYDYFLKNDQYMIDDDIGRNVNDKPMAGAQNYHYDIYSSQWYNIENVDYIYKLIDGALLRDNVSDNSLDVEDSTVIATDVGSWVSSPDDYTIIYVKESTNQLISINFDGANQRVLGSFNENGIVIDVASIGDAYVLTCTTSMNGITTQINANK